uniref:Uncharacterized protein n=1 Tax=Kalanchoe fedtschenkoi TaxID=63787 RepID=A0A7N0TXZ5_KALFE
MFMEPSREEAPRLRKVSVVDLIIYRVGQLLMPAMPSGDDMFILLRGPCGSKSYMVGKVLGISCAWSLLYWNLNSVP